MADWTDVLAAQQAAQAPAAYMDGRLAKEWVIPPMSVLDTRSGAWQERRQAWLALGIESEIGRRGDALIKEGSQARMNDILRSGHRGANDSLPTADYAQAQYGGFQGISVFDPVLCELAYRWWCPPGGSILDPFAGGSVRGIVAARLGHPYTGIDLSAAQVAANREQASAILGGTSYPMPRWYVGDSLEVLPDLPAGTLFDMVFTCPPYYDLEVYSDDPKDLSAMASYGAFLEVYQEIIAYAVKRLRTGGFGVVVVSNVRDKRTGYYQPLERDTELAFERASAFLYNEAVLVNSVGTVALRAMNQMVAARKLGRVHQAVLCFAKGKPDTHGWDHQREAPPEPQLSMALDPEPPAPEPLPLVLTDQEVEDAPLSAAVVDDAYSQLKDAMAAAVGADPADGYEHTMEAQPDPAAAPGWAAWAELGARLDATKRGGVPRTPDPAPTPDSVALEPRHGPPAPLGQPTLPPHRGDGMVQVRPAADFVLRTGYEGEATDVLAQHLLATARVTFREASSERDYAGIDYEPAEIRLEAGTLAVRIRSADAYRKEEFTLRFTGARGGQAEWARITGGSKDPRWYVYGWIGRGGLDGYYLIDMDVFREQRLWEGARGPIPNKGDKSSFMAMTPEQIAPAVVASKAGADQCERCGQPRGPGHEHPAWTTPEHAAELYAAGVWNKADATDDDVAALQGAGLWDGL